MTVFAGSCLCKKSVVGEMMVVIYIDEMLELYYQIRGEATQWRCT